MTTLVLPFQFAGVGLKTPTARLDANFEAVAEWLNTHGFLVGLIGVRPPPTSVGAIYVATDQNLLWYMADGTAWHPVGRAGDGTIDVDPITGNVRLFGAAVGADAAGMLVCGLATGLPTTSPPAVAQLYVADTQGVAGRAAWHQRTEDGWAHPLDRVLFRLIGNPAVPITNSVAEVSLYSQSLQGGTLGIAGLGGQRPRAVELTLGLDVLNSTGASRTLTLRVKLGGATGASDLLTIGTTAIRRGTVTFRLDAISTNQQAVSQPVFQWDALPTHALTLAGLGLDGTLAQLLEVTGQFNFASTGLTLNLYTVHLSLV